MMDSAAGTVGCQGTYGPCGAVWIMGEGKALVAQLIYIPEQLKET